MKKLLQHERVQRHVSQLWRFVICGGIAALIDLTSVGFFVRSGVPAYIAFIPSSLLAVVFVFFANKYFTFKNREPGAGSQFAKFILVYGIAIALNIALSNAFYWVGERFIGDLVADEYIALLAKAGAIGIGAVFNYTLSHGYIFKRHSSVEEEVVVI